MPKKIVIDLSARGKNGGLARAAKMNPAQRAKAARKAVNERWRRWREERGIPEPVKKSVKRSRKAA